ncbi:MAG: hypothetical protein R3222_06795, partial [Balneolaceae bacterium]|nr:hypothetical protein [Balneolaceae bacterium]
GLSGGSIRKYINLIREKEILPPGTRMEAKDSGIQINAIPSWSETTALKRELDKLLKEGLPVIFLNEYRAN